MKISHADLITIANLLGYSNIKGGLCAGFSAMYGHSVFAQDEASFYKRLHFIATYKNNFPQLIEEIGKAQKKTANSLNEKDMQLLDILAFFDGIELYLSPLTHKDYFPNQCYINQ